MKNIFARPQASHSRGGIPRHIIVFLILMFLWACAISYIPVAAWANISPMSNAQPPGQSHSSASTQAYPGQPQVDQYTVALYHFDAPTGTNQVIDETGRYTGTLHGGATVSTEGLYGGVLNLDGQGSYVDIGKLGPLSQGTIELFVDYGINCGVPGDPSLVVAGGQYGTGVVALSLNESTLFDIYTNGQRNRADSGINPCRYLTGAAKPYFDYAGYAPWPYETRRFHHVAATWGPRGMEVWMDGVLHGVGRTDPPDNVYKYSCNPQMYAFIQPGPYSPVVINPFYPDKCIQPDPAPLWTPAYPSGDYAGPLPPYDTILIGCKPTGACFKGRIDEVRISNIQRTFHYSVVPTITPVPTATPAAPIAGEYTVDLSTQALYHLNGWTPCMFVHCVQDSVTGQAFPAIGDLLQQGRYNGGLTNKNGVLVVDMTNLTNYWQGSVETWVNFGNGVGRQPIFFVGRYSGDWEGVLHLGALSQTGVIYLGIHDGVETRSALSTKTPNSLKGCWHHIAGTWGPRGVELWIDGVLENRNTSYTGGMPSPGAGWRLGANMANDSLVGALDEAVITSAQRHYTTTRLGVSRLTHAPFASELQVLLPFIGKNYTPAPVSNCPFQ